MSKSTLAALTTALLIFVSAIPARGESTPSFADFDRRAAAGEKLNVVFFGASLTWGANARDPNQTSYRAVTAGRLEAAYPEAHFKFSDAAIGGTGSQLGVFRLDRDVLAHKPDLVFVDFSANDDINSDDPETLASYEAIVRRIIVEAKAPVVQVIFPFMWDVKAGKLDAMKRRTAHFAIAKAYGAAVGDAIGLAIDGVAAGRTTLQRLWPVDGVHPCEEGYALFSDAAWQAFRDAVDRHAACAAPAKMLYAETYMTSARVHLSTLAAFPAGWQAGKPNLTSAYFDMLMSRWLDDELIAALPAATDKAATKPAAPQRLRVKFRGTMVMLFGEGTPQSGAYRAYIDGALVHHDDNRQDKTEFDGGWLGRMSRGNVHLVQRIATGLDPAAEHTLEIEPLLEPGLELRLESICIAGPGAAVMP